MRLAMIGLGRMGGNMVRRLMGAGHEVIVYSATAKTRESFANATGAFAASSIDELVAKLKPPRVIWMMVPAAAVERYVGTSGRIIDMKTFGASAPLKELQKKFGFETTWQRA